MGNGYCSCNSDTGDVPASKCEYKVDISDNSILLNNINNPNNQSRLIDNNNNFKEQNNEFMDNIFPGGDNINNFFENKEKGLSCANNQIQNNVTNSNNINSNNETFNENKKEIDLEQKDAIEEEGDEDDKKSNVIPHLIPKIYVKLTKLEKNNSSKSQNIEKGNEEILKVFDNFIKDHAEYIDDNAYDKAMNPKVKEIEKNLDIIEEKFESEIHNLKLFKRPPLLFKSNNMIYNGSWNSKFLKEGYGISIDKDGNKYIGYWKEDSFDGNGRLISIKGDYYEGNWSSGNMEGNGIFYSTEKKRKYDGQFKYNKFNGRGKLIYENEKIVYEGDFINGLKEGKGIIIFGSKGKYEGEFKNDCFWGEGVFDWGDGRKYSGGWKKNLMDGTGEFIYDSKNRYKGEFKENKKHGKGTYYQGDTYYIGDWFNNLPHGEGKIYANNKVVINGSFRYGKFVGRNEERNGIKKESKKSNKIEDFGAGLKMGSNKSIKTNSDKKEGKHKEKEKNKSKEKPKKMVSLNTKNKVANPLDFKSGFLEKHKQKKK